MNRLPVKQIYLLSIIIIGIIALSVYSTYALFTFESSTSDIVSIHTPKSLTISENIYEYQQIIAEPNTVTTTNVDIYNAFDYEVCYSVWYKIVGDEDVRNRVQIFEKTDENLQTSGALSPSTSISVTIAIINDNDTQVKVNIGTIGASKKENSCSLNLSDDKKVIDSSYKNIDVLTTKILEGKDTIKEIEAGYLIYQNITETITFEDSDEIYISTEFTYENEIFTLTKAEKLTLQEFTDKYNLQIKGTYFCLDAEQCKILYRINNIEKETIDREDNQEIKYHIVNYDKLIGYSEGINGLRKINETDYVYYGDNPNNYIYYNCEDNDNLETCELWRIVGFFYNQENKEYNTKIVRNESIGKYQFDYKMTNNINESTNSWFDSTLNKYLNEEYKLNNNYDIYIEEYQQSLERIPNLESDVKDIKVTDENIISNINLLNLSDYLYASSCEKTKINEYFGECFTNNWLNDIEITKEWTLTSKEVEEIELPIETPATDEIENEEQENSEVTEDNILDKPEEEITPEEVETNNYVINYVYSIGQNITENDVNDSLDVRPVVFLKARILLLEGTGSFQEPYIVK